MFSLDSVIADAFSSEAFNQLHERDTISKYAPEHVIGVYKEA